MDKIKRGDKVCWLNRDSRCGLPSVVTVSCEPVLTTGAVPYTAIGFSELHAVHEPYYYRWLACFSFLGHIGEPCVFCGYTFPDSDKKYLDLLSKGDRTEAITWPK